MRNRERKFEPRFESKPIPEELETETTPEEMKEPKPETETLTEALKREDFRKKEEELTKAHEELEKTFQEGKVESLTESRKKQQQEFLRNEIKRTSRIAGELLRISDERKNYRLNPLFELNYSREYIKSFIPIQPPEDKDITEEDLKNTENQVLGLSFEVSDQILQPKPKKETLREDANSLKQIYEILIKGGKLFREVQEKRPEDVQNVLKRILTEGRGVPEEKIKPEQIKQLAASLGNSRGLIRRRIESLEAYFRTR